MSDPYAGFSAPQADPYEGIAVPYPDYVSTPSAPQLDPSEYDPNSAAYQAKYGTVAGNSFWRNALIGAGKLYTDVGLGARQIGAQLSGADQSAVVDPFTGQNAADKRATDVAINSTGGGRVGQIAGALPLAFIPGANTYAGAALIGGGMGAFQPTTGDESRLLNTGIGAGVGIASKYAGDALSQWAANRVTQPFMGWTPKAGDAALARGV